MCTKRPTATLKVIKLDQGIKGSRGCIPNGIAPTGRKNSSCRGKPGLRSLALPVSHLSFGFPSLFSIPPSHISLLVYSWYISGHRGTIQTPSPTPTPPVFHSLWLPHYLRGNQTKLPLALCAGRVLAVRYGRLHDDVSLLNTGTRILPSPPCKYIPGGMSISSRRHLPK